ncbi:hypothetical protein BH10PSE4_BH10PSE4_01740 [soil metagenome]
MMASIAAAGRRTAALAVPITDLARRLGVTPRTLRHYQDLGLIRSQRIARNIRAYDLETVATIETIVALRDAGLPIVVIREILRSGPEDQPRMLRAALTEVLADMDRQRVRVAGLLDALSNQTLLAPALSA